MHSSKPAPGATARVGRRPHDASPSWLRTVGTAAAALAMLALSACSSSSTAGGATTTVPGTTGRVTTGTGGASAPSSVDPNTPQKATPVVARVPVAPIPFAGSDNKTHAVYELFLTNAAREPATISRLEVLDAASGTAVETLDPARLNDIFSLANSQPSNGTLGPAQSGTVYLHLVFDDAGAVPATLTHKLAVSYPTAGSLDESAVGTTQVDKRKVPELGPPLKGSGYLAADACCDAVRHRRATLPVNGAQVIAQRYAVDWEQIDDQGRVYNGDKLNLNSYAIYGDEALAMADGTVVKLIDGLPEQVPGTYPEGIPFDEADGNSIVLDIGGGNYLNYAHMQKGSLKVKLGDKVKRGDVVGLVGNTGNSVAPHLHVHLMDSPLPVASSGLPYTISSFTISGVTVSTEAFDKAEAEGTVLEYRKVDPPTSHTNQYPMDQSLVTF
jgi:murein DD-endopeptidase MepM/ murein hydrolase activator NlpD